MGATLAADITSRRENKDRKRVRAFEQAKITQERDDENEDKKKKREAGRAALIQTTPRGVLGNQNSGRKQLS